MSENLTKNLDENIKVNNEELSETGKMLRDARILFIITLLAGLILGLVYQVTLEPIAFQKEKAKTAAFKEVFADAVRFEEVTDISLEEANAHLNQAGYTAQKISDAVIQALDGTGQVLGYVLTVTTSEGYNGDIVFTMGIRLDGTLNGVSILTISETPGLGMKAEEILNPQFAQMNVPKFEYTKTGAVSDSQIDAISGATITTNAYVNGVNAGLEYFQAVLKGGTK